MQSLNHDKNDMNGQQDLDELFRRAAEFNSLSAGAGEWDKVLERLSSGTRKVPPVTILTSQNGRFRFGFRVSLIAILLFLILCLYKPGSIIQPSVKAGKAKLTLPNKDSLLSMTGLLIPPKEAHSTTGSFLKTKNSFSASTGSLTEQHKKHLPSERTLLTTRQMLSRYESHLSAGSSSKTGKTVVSLPLSENTRAIDRTVLQLMPFVKKWEHINEIYVPQVSVQNLTWKPAIQSADSILVHNRSLSRQRNPGIYLGVTGSLDLSKVKAQAMNKRGYTTGLIIGYRFHTKVSLESGFLWNKRKYYSDGKYFNMNKVGATMPSDMKIMSVDGELSSFEIPIKLKYNLGIGKNSNLFVSSGLISNIFLNEQNQYLTELNGIQKSETASYKDVTYSVFSVLSISTGYELLNGRSYSIRFEPYIKIPLKTMGVGSLPVMSAGVGVTISNFLGRQSP